MQVDDRYLVIQMPEEIDHHQAVIIRKKADEIIMEGRILYIVFDFANTKLMDSSGIGIIMGRQRLMEQLGGQIYVTNANERIRKILYAAGLQKIINIMAE